MSTYGGQRLDGEGLADNPPPPPTASEGGIPGEIFSRGGVSTYGGHGLDGFREMENPPPLRGRNP